MYKILRNSLQISPAIFGATLVICGAASSANADTPNTVTEDSPAIAPVLSPPENLPCQPRIYL